MEVRKFIVKTTQITIATWATSKEAAIQIVMNAESCPHSAVLEVREGQ